MPLMVSGRVHHHHMQPDLVRAKLSERLPGLLISAPEFALERNGCKIEFFCNTTSTLDFTVTRIAVSGPAPATVTDLARETQTINSALLRALGRKFRKAEFGYCYIEDEKSRSNLLTWERAEPLKSRPAKLSYLLCVALLILGVVLVYLTFKQKPSTSRNDDIVSLCVAIGVSALTLPLPFVYEHLKSRGGGNWIYAQKGEG